MNVFDMAGSFLTAVTVQGQLIGYANGLIIAALLLLVFFLIRKINRDRKEKYSRFCYDCCYLTSRVLSDAKHCAQKCLYNPGHKHSTYRSIFKKRHG